MQKSRLNVSTLGTSFELEVGEKEDYVDSIYNYYLSILKKAEMTSDVDDPLKVAIIAGLFLTDEVFKARMDAANTTNNPEAFVAMENTAMKIIAKIDDVIHDGV